ncbi:ABC transporter permease [Candidatus Parcubacteria bacterium]|nr:MAG: ABC transporter permease [Candidatus Parcubacteria bacterium]
MTRKIGRLERFLGPEPYRILKGLVTNPLSVIGLILIALFTLVAVGAPVIAPPPNPNQPYRIPRDGFSAVPKPPGSEWRSRQPPLPSWWKPLTGKDQWVHIMGTASGQWDIYYGIVWGTRTAFKVGLIIVVLTLIIGLLIGSISAYYGGVVDNVLMRITDVFMTFPFLIAALTLSTILTPIVGRSIVPAIVAIVVFGWMGYARLIRGDILSVKERDFVLAAKALGVRDGRILFRHIIPNAIFPTIVVASMDMGSIVLSFSALSFLGIGAEVGYADWGQLLSFARNWITDLANYWYVVTFPGLAIFLYVLAWNLVGDAVRDLFDPRLRGQS